MKKVNKIIQIIWLAVAAISAVEAYKAYSDNGGFNTRVYVMIGAFVVGIVMYSLRKRQGKSIK